MLVMASSKIRFTSIISFIENGENRLQILFRPILDHARLKLHFTTLGKRYRINWPKNSVLKYRVDGIHRSSHKRGHFFYIYYGRFFYTSKFFTSSACF